MPYFDPKTKEIQLKIVYYGAGLSGKTTNVQQVHNVTPAPSRSELVSLATEQDRTLYFDFMAFDAGKINGNNIRVSLFTVPGQQPYNRTRKEVLNGVDGVVFVADSSKTRWAANIDSLNNMVDNLENYNIDVKHFPLVIQYNKRDLSDAMPVEKMESDLNTLKVPSFEAIALEGKGVIGTLKALVSMVVSAVVAS